MHAPYIGMTDVPDALWLRRMAEDYSLMRDVFGPLRQLQAGVMMSRKTLLGEPTSWAGVWPKNEEIAGVFIHHPLVLNTLHYADYDGLDVAECLDLAVGYGGPNLDALQLDMIWPWPPAIIRLKRARPDLRIILQVGTKALEDVGDDPKKMMDRVSWYGQAVDDLLLDKSAGKGLGLDAAFLRPFIAEAQARRPDIGVTVAGGLGPDTLHLVEGLVREFPTLSIDAQGRLRPSGSNRDPIDRDLAADYLRKAVAMFDAVRAA